MAEQKTRQSKRKAPPKVDETAEPTGIRKALENPIVILLIVIVSVLLLLFGIWALARFLSGS